MSDGGGDRVPDLPVSRRQLMMVAAAGAAAMSSLSAALSSNPDQGNLYGGKMALAEAFKVADKLWIGPDSAKSTVAHKDGRVYLASDTDVDYYSDSGAWVKRSVGSSSEPVPSVTTEGIAIDQPFIWAFARDFGFDTVNPMDYSDGGAAIQAAVDDLPANGGTVFLSEQGPDTVDGETGVWAVNSTIATSGKHGVHLHGAGNGWGSSEDSGTALVAESAVDPMLDFNGGFLDGIRDIRIDGNNLTNANIKFRDSNDMKIFNTMIHNSDGWAVEIVSARNVWIDGCWIEFNGAANNEGGVSVNPAGNDDFWFTNNLFAGNYRGIVISSTTNRLMAHNNRFENTTTWAIAVDNPLNDSHISKTTFENPGTGMIFNTDLTNVSIDGVYGNGESGTDFAISAGNAPPTFTNCAIKDVRVRNMTSTPIEADLDLPGLEIEGLSSGTATLSGGSTPAATIAGAGAVEQAQYEARIHPNATGPAADYGFSARPEWDDSDGEWDIVVEWDTDPGGGNDVAVDYIVDKVA